MGTETDPDLKGEVKRAVATGRFMGTGPDSSQDDLQALWGQAGRVVVKKGVKTVSYPGVDFLFENHSLRQVTVKVGNERQEASLRELLKEYPVETVEEIPPYFRCLKLVTGECAVEQVLVTTAYEKQGGAISVAVVFPKKATRTVEVELPLDVYIRLQALSNAVRLPIAELCARMIGRGTEEKEK